ncbi:hypothetical protein AYO40_04430 [Planctomycetaceae bacterium SCGC AG-212-D15]|nr:hypothetical protein AYO40_04430 [Planctomycetaceae bacterium SCGC AG-212-D15]
MSTSLILHRGAREVAQKELDSVRVPPATATWFPIPHAQVLSSTVNTLSQAGFQVTRQRLALSKDDAQFFATLDLQTALASGVTLAVGIRNSIDRSLPIGFCAGHRTFICDNLAFSSEIVVARKHTRFGAERFNAAICKAVQTLDAYRETEGARIKKFQQIELSADAADALLLRAYEHDIISTPLLPRIIQEWRQPTFEEFQPRTLWSLMNSFTTVLADRQKSNPQQFAALTIKLHDFFQSATSKEPMNGMAV